MPLGSPSGFGSVVCVLVAQSCLTLCDSMDCSPPGSSCLWDFPGKDTGVGCHFLVQESFLTQGQNPGLLHCRQILYRLSYEGSVRRVYFCRHSGYLHFHQSPAYLWDHSPVLPCTAGQSLLGRRLRGSFLVPSVSQRLVWASLSPLSPTSVSWGLCALVLVPKALPLCCRACAHLFQPPGLPFPSQGLCALILALRSTLCIEGFVCTSLSFWGPRAALQGQCGTCSSSPCPLSALWGLCALASCAKPSVTGLILLLVFKGTTILYSTVGAPVYIPRSSVGGFFFLYFLSIIYYLYTFDDGPSDRYEVILFCSFDLHFSNNQQY